MQLSIPEITSIDNEPPHIIDSYGADSGNETKRDYARNCILARRLIEKGVRVVQLFNGSDAGGGNGTILGGIWANYSWGRFWGWDPTENGALLICLFELMILHARLGGYIKDRGLACCAIVGGIVVSMSWWGVNLLGIGLHSYGFTTGVFASLLGYWTSQGVVLAISGGHWLVERGAASAKSTATWSGPRSPSSQLRPAICQVACDTGTEPVTA